MESCSLDFAEMKSEMLQPVLAGPSGEEVQGLVLLAVDCCVYAEGLWLGWDQGNCCCFCWDGM